MPGAVRRSGALLAALAASLFAQPIESLPGTAPLTWKEDLADRLMDGAHRFVERQIAESAGKRQRRWSRDDSSPQAYDKSVAPNRGRFRERIGVVDERLPVTLERFGDDANPALVAETPAWRAWQVRWPVLEGVHGEGLLLEPKAAPAAYVVALPDADQTPEQLAGLAAGLAAPAQLARRLADSGCVVLVPILIDRSTRFSGRPGIRIVNDQTHREWIYRQAYHLGRHIIGYEVQKVLAAVDWFLNRTAGKVAIAGFGEGGLIAFYSAAADTRIDAALVSGYFGPREAVWAEPIYRNVWGLLAEFGDAEIASLIAPRTLVVEYAQGPEAKGHKGDLTTPDFAAVEKELRRIDSLVRPGFFPKHLVNAAAASDGVATLLQALRLKPRAPRPAAVADRRKSFDPAARQLRQIRELDGHAQLVLRRSERARRRFFLHKAMPELAERKWNLKLRLPTHPPDKFIEAARWYRQHFRDELIGRFEDPALAANPRTRRIYDTPEYAGYDVVLDVFPELIAWGVLLVPKDIRPGERRPVVVCQHGRGGVPYDLITGNKEAYNDFASRLAGRGFVVFGPHNLYRGEDRYRWLDRKAAGVKASLFSFILAQHAQILDWLKGLPFVDPGRIGFYGLSYGGKTAVRIPAILEDYALSICSGDFNYWANKIAADDEWFSYVFTEEWEMPTFNLGNTYDYAEMAYLIFPRPFMVERGHHDHVAEDRWVDYEYAKVRWLYAQFGLPGRTEIEHFNGGHTINAEGTFRFLHKHLNWPER